MRYVVALSLAGLVGACGGGGGGSSGVAPIGSTPTPAPTTSPSPAPSYAVAFDQNVDQRLLWYTVESRERYLRTGAPGTGVNSEISTELRGEGVDALNYRAADQSISILNAGRYGGTTSFAGSDLRTRRTETLEYGRTDARLSLAALISSPQPYFGTDALDWRYVVVGGLSRRAGAFGFDEEVTRYTFVAGTRTLATDIPASGTIQFDGYNLLRLVAPAEAASGTFRGRDQAFRIDFAGNTVSSVFVLTRTETPASNITLTFTGQLNRETGELRGTISSPEGYAGNFQGRLFGPAGREPAFVYSLSRGDERGAGTVAAFRR